MPIIYLLCLFLLVFSLGLSLCLWLRVKSWLEIWGLSWLLGMGWGSMFWFLSYYLMNQAFSLSSAMVVLGLSNFLSWLGLIISQRASLQAYQEDFQYQWRSKAWEKFWRSPFLKWSILLLGLITGFVFFQDIFWPVTDWDALALYDFRAKVILATGSMAEGKNLEYFFQYPLFTTVLHAWTYLSGLGIAKIWYALIYQAAVVLYFVVLSRKTSLKMSMIGTLLFATSPLIFTHAYTAYTNLSYTIFGGLGFIYLWQWWDTLNLRNLILGSLLVGLSTWVRISEPFYLIAVVIIVVGTLKTIKIEGLRPWSLVVSLFGVGSVLLTRYPWDSMITALYGTNVNTPFATFSLIQNWSLVTFLSRITEVVRYLWINSAPVYLWYAILGLGLLVIDLKHKRWQVLFPWMTIGMLLGSIFIGTLFLSFILESWNRIGDSVNRMSLFLVPLWMYVIFASPSWKKSNQKL